MKNLKMFLYYEYSNQILKAYNAFEMLGQQKAHLTDCENILKCC